MSTQANTHSSAIVSTVKAIDTLAYSGGAAVCGMYLMVSGGYSLPKSSSIRTISSSPK